MVVRRSLPSIDASDAPARTITLADLRDLVAASGDEPGDLIVRIHAIPFHWADLGNQLGSRCMALALDAADPK